MKKSFTINLKLKIFVSIFLSSLCLVLLFGVVTFADSKSRIEHEFFSRYQSIATLAGDTLVQLEKNSKNLSIAAAQYLYLVDSQRGILSNDELRVLTEKLGVSQMCITDSNGRFLRDTESNPEEQTKTLFDFCDDYRNLLNGKSKIESTPIIPSYPYKGPYKFTMIPNHDRSRILEVGIKLDFIADVLRNAVASDKNLNQLRLFSPNGFNLGSIDKEGKVWSGDHIDSSLYKTMIGSWIENKGKMNFVSKIHASSENCCECKTKNILEGNDDFYYLLVTEVSTEPLRHAINSLTSKILIMYGVAFFIALISANFLSKIIVKKIDAINDGVNKIMASNNLALRLGITGSDEAASLAKNFDKMIESLDEQQKRLISAEKTKAFASISSQVAHDIRSPVAALEMVVKDLGTLPEAQRNIMRSALARIKDIANDLIEKNRAILNPKQTLTPPEGHDLEIALLSSLVDSLVSEKRIQYRSKIGVDISFQMSEETYGIFSKINIAHFQRMLSNLVNNAVEAMKDRGNININLRSDQPWAILEIKDDGSGISPEFLEKLGQRGFSNGKIGGSGLGLYHAKSQVESWGGVLEITSVIGHGTLITIKLKLESPPQWFIKQINVRHGINLVVVDDDVAIHNIWKSRFAPFIQDEGLNIHHFTDIGQFCAWFRDPQRDQEKRRFLILIDFEFLGSQENGLDAIKNLEIENQSILVTSRFEEPEVKAICESLKVGCIPKGLAGFVPIVFKAPRAGHAQGPIHAVLIDDDLWMRECWKLIGEQKGKTVLTYSNPEDFLKDEESFDRSQMIFIDVQLGHNEIDGVDLGNMLDKLGFQQIYLSTGFLESQFEGIKWVKGIVNKEPPEWLWTKK